MTVSLDMMPYNADSRPRQLVYSKMERLITTMNDQKTGIPLKDKKNFLTTLPSSFTGYDFINWLSDRMCEGNTTEAMHIASFLCLYGYIYPIDVKSFSVKEEKNIHYRFQSPHHWPSKNLKLTNEKYIIYLLKRSKRNKKKHGLEEYEQMKQALVKHFFLVVHFTQKSAVLISIIDGGPKCRIYSFISSPEYEVLKVSDIGPSWSSCSSCRYDSYDPPSTLCLLWDDWLVDYRMEYCGFHGVGNYRKP